MRKQIVYLAGGFHNDWREEVKTLCDNVDYIDPKAKEAVREFEWFEYAHWDLHYIKQCDIVFAFMDKNNPSGYGMSVEIGYANALGKTVILVLEEGHPKYNYLKFMMGCADVVYNNLDSGTLFLRSFK